MGAGEDELRTTDRTVLPDSEPGQRAIRSRRILYAISSLALTSVVVLGVVDALGLVDAYGVSTDWVADEGGGYELDVRYATLSRPALATPFEIVVRRAGGFDGPVTVAVDRQYMAMWDENGFYPTPSSETTRGHWLLWEFDPPAGEVLAFAYDARIEPAAQWGERGAVAVMDDDEIVARVEFRTRLRP